MRYPMEMLGPDWDGQKSLVIILVKSSRDLFEENPWPRKDLFEHNGHRLEPVGSAGYVPLTCGFAVGEQPRGALFRPQSLETH